MALPGPAHYNLTDARRVLREKTGRDIIEPLLIDLIGQGMLRASIQLPGVWLSLKEPYKRGLLMREHQHHGIVDIEVSEHQAQLMRVNPYAVVETETVFRDGVAWQTDLQQRGHGFPVRYDATCLLIKRNELDRFLAEMASPDRTAQIATATEPETGEPTAIVETESAAIGQKPNDAGGDPSDGHQNEARFVCKNAIVSVFGEIYRDRGWWSRSLGDPTGWLAKCARTAGRKGRGGGARWNPLDIALGVLDQDKGTLRQIHAAFSRDPRLAKWKDDWIEHHVTYYADR